MQPIKPINDEATLAEMKQKLLDLEDRFVRLQARTAAVEYLIRKGKPLGEKISALKDELQPNMYRLSKEVTEKLKPKE